ncbi:MAG: signal peptidase [Myxococcales bacterium]|nr:signal peptidase [Myxococcales bacterium]
MGRAVAAALGSLVVPGFGHGVAGRKWPAIIWAVVGLVSIISIVFSIWGIYVSLLVRVACAVDTVRIFKRETARLEWLTVLSGIALVAGAIESSYLGRVVQLFKIPSPSMYPALEIGDHIYVDSLTIDFLPIRRGELITFRYPCQPDRTYVKRIVAVAGDTVEVRCSVLYVNGKAAPSELVDANASYRDHDELADTWSTRAVSLYRETLDGHSYEIFSNSLRPRRDRLRETRDVHDFPDLDSPFAPSCHAPGAYEHGPSAEQPIGKIVETKPVGPDKCDQRMGFVVPQGGLFGLGDNRDNANDSRYWGALSTKAVTGRVVGVFYSSGEHGFDWRRIGAVH